MIRLRYAALALLLAATLAGCVCAPATAPLTDAPSDEEIAQARRTFGYNDVQNKPADKRR